MKKTKTKKTCKFCNKTQSVDKFYKDRRLCKQCYYWAKKGMVNTKLGYADQIYTCCRCKKPKTCKDLHGNRAFEFNKNGGKVCHKCDRPGYLDKVAVITNHALIEATKVVVI